MGIPVGYQIPSLLYNISHDFRMHKKFYRNILSLPPKKIYIYVQ